MSLAVYGVRHHGPGSARSVERALEEFEPDVVLIEGPPEADVIVPLARDEGLTPPVAILAYATDQPRRAAFYPFANFSPEWRALRYALARDIPVRFADLPLAHLLALRDESDEADVRTARDPLGELAAQAGYEDGERWWDRFVERRRDDAQAFAAVEELMDALRASQGEDVDREDERREAAMRQAVRAARKEFERVAFVCGAWHAPAMRADTPASADARVLRGLPKIKVNATWVPWTHGRLARASGYGAGIVSPGWYEHLFHEPHERVVTSWMAKAARAFRESGIDIASAHAIEATRLAVALAALRDAPVPGLDDLTEAIRSVYLFGDVVPLALLREKLIVAERLGSVPAHVANVPLLADLGREQKRLRLAPDPESRELDLDLRKPTDLERSRLLHRLQVLGVPWGRLGDGTRRSTGTFRESWRVCWQPEFAVALVESSIYGNTVASAAVAAVRERAAAAADLAELAKLLEVVLVAQLPEALDDVLERLRNRAAGTHDVAALLEAIAPLANVRRYGDVRGTDAAAAGTVLEELLARASVGLLPASLALDDEAAEKMFARIVSVDAAVRTLELESERELWDGALQALAGDERVHGLVAGRALRMLFDAQLVDAEAFRVRISYVLGKATDPAAAAAWLEGALRDSGVVLVHQPQLLGAIDAWLTALEDATFVQTVALARRVFGTFEAAERRAIGERIAASRESGEFGAGQSGETGEIDWGRARSVLPVLRLLLGSEEPSP